jgi:leader peptidase (prepilin peptidase) / N-methyltransferase
MDIVSFFQSHMSITLPFITIIGLIVGSFLTVLIVRYPKMLEQQIKSESMQNLKQEPKTKPRVFNLTKPRSHCGKCRKKLKNIHNIPLVGYILLRGKCGFCKAPISLTYPIIELLAAAAAFFTISYFGFTWAGGAALVFSWSLIALSFMDIQKNILPDNLTLPLLWLGLIANVFGFYSTPGYAILGAVAGYSLLWVIAMSFKLIRKKDGMGHGDFKMLAMLGAWLGISMLINVLLTAVIIALIISLFLMLIKKLSTKNPIPFGPYLAISGWMTMIYGPTLMDCIMKMLS